MLSVIIPCKEAHRSEQIMKMLAETERWCPESAGTAEIIIVNDRYGRGKGFALREGVKNAKGDCICFIDSDLDIHPSWIDVLHSNLERFDIVIGRKPIEGRISRRIITFCSRIFIGVLFGLWIDTQTGIKMFKRSALPDWSDNSFAFDIEVLSKAKRAGAKITEFPITANITKSMPFRSILQFIRGAINIKWRLCFEK